MRKVIRTLLNILLRVLRALRALRGANCSFQVQLPPPLACRTPIARGLLEPIKQIGRLLDARGVCASL
jgi:hypothetical protein